MEVDPEELIRTTRMTAQEIDIVLHCVSKAFYPYSKRQMSGLFIL